MTKKTYIFLFTLPFLFSSCSFKDRAFKEVRCENLFTLVSDFDHRYPNQDDYMLFLKNGYYETFYYKQENGFDCHYRLEYQNGYVIDEWGNYMSDGKVIEVYFAYQHNKTLTFSYYHSPTIDFHIIDTLKYNDKEYKIVYQGRYIITSKG